VMIAVGAAAPHKKTSTPVCRCAIAAAQLT